MKLKKEMRQMTGFKKILIRLYQIIKQIQTQKNKIVLNILYFKSELFLFRLLTIQYRIKIPKAPSSQIDVDLKNILEDNICVAINK